jgi:hypothetical protein
MGRIFNCDNKVILRTFSVILWGMSFSQTHGWNYKQCRENCTPPSKCSTLEKAEQCAKECFSVARPIVEACRQNAQRLAAQTSSIGESTKPSQPKPAGVPTQKMEESRQRAQVTPSPRPLPQTESKPLVTFEELPEITLELPKSRQKTPEVKVEQQPPVSKEITITPKIEETQQQPLSEKPFPESTSEGQIQEPQMPLPKADIVVEPKPDTLPLEVPLQSTASQELRYAIAEEVNQYFGKPYTDLGEREKEKVSEVINNQSVTIYRPRHGLAHGMRQAFLAIDIVTVLNKIDAQNTPLSNEGKALVEWVQRKFKEDPHFIEKIEMLSAFQRTGRKSEATESKSKNLFFGYLVADAVNFKKFAEKHKGTLFASDTEIKIYYNAFIPTPDSDLFKDATIRNRITSLVNHYKLNNQLTNAELVDVKQLNKILLASHWYDLKRLPAYQAENKKDACNMLFGEKEPKDNIIMNVCNNLWERSGEYLDATGDKNFNMNQTIRKEYATKFYILSKDPKALVDALTEAREKSNIKDFTVPPSMKARAEMRTISPPPSKAEVPSAQEQKAIGIAPVKPQLPIKVPQKTPPVTTAKPPVLAGVPQEIQKDDLPKMAPPQQPQQVVPTQKKPVTPPLATKPEVSQMVSPPLGATTSVSGTVVDCPQNVPASVELQMEHRCPQCQGSDLSEKYKFYITKVGPMAQKWEGYIANTDNEPNKKDKMLRRFHYLASFMDGIAQAERKYCDYIPMFAGGDVALAFLTHVNRALEDITKGRISNPFEAGDKPRELSDRFSDTETEIKLKGVESVFTYLSNYNLSLLSEAGTKKPGAPDLLSKFASVSFSMLDTASGDSAFDYFLHHTNINLSFGTIGNITKGILKRHGVLPDDAAYDKLIQDYNQVIDKVLIQYLVHKNKVNEVVYLAQSWGAPFSKAPSFKNYTRTFIENYQRQSKQDFINSVSKANRPGTREIPTSVNDGKFQGRLLQTSPLLKDENSIKYYLYYAPTRNAMKGFEIEIEKLYYQLALQIIADIQKSGIKSINDVPLKNLEQLQETIKSNLEQLESQEPQQIAIGQ